MPQPKFGAHASELLKRWAEMQFSHFPAGENSWNVFQGAINPISGKGLAFLGYAKTGRGPVLPQEGAAPSLEAVSARQLSQVSQLCPEWVARAWRNAGG